MYPLLRPLLFALDAERSHNFTLGLLHAAARIPGMQAVMRCAGSSRTAGLPVEAMGLHFPNPVGLAAGLDKEAGCAGVWDALGFGFAELGTVTPLPQPGNPRPRLFRLPADEALINRMGFNSGGLSEFLANLTRGGRHGIIGINLGKNKDTSVERATEDYLIGLRAVYAHADYITVNISSPNTPGLRMLQNEAPLASMLATLKAEQTALAVVYQRRVPLVLKIAPDLADEAIDAIARLVIQHRIDGVMATNTTLARDGLTNHPHAQEVGGLSGQPLRHAANHVVTRLYQSLRGHTPIIGVGGIFSAEDAWERLVAGADLVQIYSAFIYRGPGVVPAIVAGLADKLRESGQPTLQQAIAQARLSKKSDAHA